MRAESVADTRAGDAGLSGRVVIGSFWMFLGTGTQHLLQFLVLIVLARLISPTVFGMVAAALLVVGFSSIFSQLGVGPAIVQRPILTPRHVRVAFTMSLLLGLALTAFLWTTAPLIAAFFRMDGLTPVLRAVSPVFICNGLATVADSLAQRGLRFRRLAGIDVVSYAVGFALVGVGLALAGWGIWALVAAHVAQSSVRTSMLLLAQPHPKRLLLRRAEVAELMYFGGGFTLARVGNYVAGFGDNLVVGRWLGPQALGLYSHAYQLMVAPAVLFGQVLDKVLFPTMARIQLEPQRLAKAYHRGITLIALVILPLSAILYILAPELILVLLGPAWAGAAVPFQVLASGMLFRTSYKLSDSVARATGAVYRRAWRQACYALVVLLGAWLGQRWGLGGVALGVLAAITVNFLLMAQLSLRLVGMSWRTFWGAHLPALPLSIACSSTVWLLATLLRRLEWPALAIVSCSGLSALAVIGTLCACAPALFLGIEGTWLRRTAWAILPLAPGPLRRLPELAAVTSLVSHKPDFAAVTRGPGPATSLRVVRELFAAFHAAEIPYCHWKSNEHLGRSMVGLTDLDVLIDKERAGVIEQILACNGLKRFTATPLRSYPGIEDYLTLDDDDTGRLVHLHLHYQLTLGEPFLKGYRLPWEPLLLSTRRMDAEHGIYIADANLEFLLVAVRGALKLRLRNMFRKRLGSAFLAELYWLRERVEPQQVLALGEELLGGRVAGPLRALLVNEPSLRTLVSLRRAAAPSLRHHRTYGPLQARARASLREGASLLTALSRTFLGMALPARRTSPRGGLIVAILGCDGSGKSSVVEEVVGSLGRKVDILPIYFGSGDGRSSVVRLPLKLAHKLMRGTVRSRPTPPRVEGQGLERTPSSHPGNRRWRTLATVIWALALSHEKRGKLRRAVRARNRGMIVICDRLPQNQVMGFNDGPLLARWSNHRAWLPRSLARWEATAYERCSTHPPDIVVKLTVSPEVAMARKPDTPAWEVRRRVEAVRQLRFPSTVQVVEIDAEAPLATVCLAVKRMIWRAA